MNFNKPSDLDDLAFSLNCATIALSAIYDAMEASPLAPGTYVPALYSVLEHQSELVQILQGITDTMPVGGQAEAADREWVKR